MKKRGVIWFCTGVGIGLLLGGLLILRTPPEPQGVFQVLPYLMIGLGCGLFGHGLGDTVQQRTLKSSPEIARQLEIEQNDERNLAIANGAKARGFDRMTFVFGALMLCFALMQVELAAVLLLVAAYLYVEGYALYSRLKLEKEM